MISVNIKTKSDLGYNHKIELALVVELGSKNDGADSPRIVTNIKILSCSISKT